MAGKKARRWILLAAAVLLIGAAIPSWMLYSWIYRPALLNMPENESFIYVRSGSDYNDLIKMLDSLDWHRNIKAFEWVAEKKNLPAHLQAGRYAVYSGMSNDSLVNLLRSGMQDEVRVTFNTMRTFNYLAEVIGKQIEADSTDLMHVLTDPGIMDSLGIKEEEWMGMFIPNTYRFFWNTDARSFINRMHQEYLRFWGPTRQAKLKQTGMTVNEVITLASIVQEETFKVDEMSRIAGLYINRLNRGMRLQADPTVLFALGDRNIKRVLRKHLRVESPYNTYRIKGLPPGPIRIPSIQAIEASLNYEKNDYLYFCAKEDFSGYHAFASSYAQHLRNARRYHRVLNERNIR